MSDVSPGRVPDPAYDLTPPVTPPVTPAVTPAVTTPGQGSYAQVQESYGQEQESYGQEQSKPRQVAEQGKAAAGDVKDTAKEQAQRVGAEARTQARNVASEVRDKLDEQARLQNGRLVGSIRQTADHLDEMRGAREDSPAAAVVSRVAEGGRQFADYLDRNGPDGVLREVEDFARRRPGAFLATALAAGFVVGRLGKSIAKADSSAGAGKPATDSFTPDYEPSRTAQQGHVGTGFQDDTLGYTPAATGTGYVTPATTQYEATGTGRPAVVDTDPEFRS
ncbi:hypothetical protein [Actinoplanes utahensis]|uniref:hypothetical protein n=1 Tax=Actinoplanes utahensis TaxID=1869 RepID=UPI000A817C81|nr:hypothetical protein [Actinoplanes utahensis]GIF34059.1 hypothetical protein Aut01nite_70450 [Actinoplanes utahensis]